MHRAARHKTRVSAIEIPLAVKGLALLFFLCVIVRLFSSFGADTASKDYISGLVSNDRIVHGILDFELGNIGKANESVSLASLILDASIQSVDNSQVETSPDLIPDVSSITSDVAPISDSPEDLGLYYNIDQYDSEAAEQPNIVTKPVTTPSSNSIAVNNKTEYAVDAAALLSQPVNISLTGDSPAVLIIHTHGSEAYMPDGSDTYTESDPYRTQDKDYSVIRVGDELAAELAKNGIAFIHDRSTYDFPSYQGAYTRSCASIQAYLKEYPSIKIVIDLHRDAIHAADGTVYRTIAQVGDTTCAQVMLVMGTNSSGLEHPNWRENFSLAVKFQNEMNTLYPSLAKPIELSPYRFNQQATTGSLLVEVGCTGNTLQESLDAARYFADAASNVLLGLYK